MADIILMPAMGLMAFYAAAALLPAIVLLRYIYRHDHIEKEPPALLIRLLLGGVLSAFAAILLETVGMWILPMFAAEGSVLYHVLLESYEGVDKLYAVSADGIPVGLVSEIADVIALRRLYPHRTIHFTQTYTYPEAESSMEQVHAAMAIRDFT